VVLLHGLTGDENVMWGLEPVIPPAARVLSPRAPFPFAGGGYSWVNPVDGPAPGMPAFREPAIALARLIDAAGGQEAPRPLVLMGFSQGSALALSAVAFGALHPAAVVVMAGLLPAGNLPALHALPVFWGHGRQDELIPVARARADVERLTSAGAAVTYCEADVGHKLGAECLKGVRTWLTGLGMDESPVGA